MPNSAPGQSYTRDHVILEDGAVAFKCDTDVNVWPWLALAPSHPIVVQMVNYYASVETGRVRGTFDPTKWSALTHHTWQCCALAPLSHEISQPTSQQGSTPARQHGHATHGVAAPADDDGDRDSVDGNKPSFGLTLFDADGAIVYRMDGRGVVFKTRDFEAWREKARAKLLAQSAPPDFTYASPQDAGVASTTECFIGSVRAADHGRFVDALITKENGFSPGHPYHAGSGDHVNAGHLVDAAAQAAHAMGQLPPAPLAIKGGSAAFTRYIELGRPFQIRLATDAVDRLTMEMLLFQADQQCAAITLRYAAI